MVTKIQPGRAALERMPMYRMLADLAPLRTSYAGKFALAAFVGVMIPLVIFIVYLLLSRADWVTMYPVIAALVLACFAITGYIVTDRKSTRLNSSHQIISYAVFCLKKQK